MATNRPRGTPGLFLLLFAVLMLGIAIAGWIQHWKR